MDGPPPAVAARARPRAAGVLMPPRPSEPAPRPPATGRAGGRARRRRSRRRTRSRLRRAARARTRAGTTAAVGGSVSCAAMIAPISAIPTEPPTWRNALSTAEPDARLVDGHGARRRGGARRHRQRHPDAAEDERRAAGPERRVRAELREVAASWTATRIIPAVISPREPMRSRRPPGDRRDEDDQDRHRQERRARLRRRSSRGCSACTARRRRRRRTSRARRAASTRFAPDVGPVPEERRASSIGARWWRSSSDERDERDARRRTNAPTIRAELQP